MREESVPGKTGMNILLADDQAAASDHVRRNLLQRGYCVHMASNGVDAFHRLAVVDYDLILMEVEPARFGGAAFLRAIRERTAAPVIVVTRCTELEMKLECLNGGADDYLVKPVALSELHARIALQLRVRRPGSAVSTRFELGDLVLDLSRTRVERAGRRLDLTRQEFSLLLFLLRHPGEVVPRKHLFEQVWGMPFERAGNLLNAAIRRLRQKMDEPYQVKLLHTVHGRGYVVDLLDEGTARGGALEPTNQITDL